MDSDKNSRETDSEAQQQQRPQTCCSFLRRQLPRSNPQQPDGDDNEIESPIEDPKCGERYAPKDGDTSATYWKLYASEAGNYDKNFVDSLKGNAESMVFLNTLFSAIVASFIIEIYKTLPSTNGQPTVTIPRGPAIRINTVLFLSFFLSIVSAVACALIQQWCYEYLKFANPQAAPHERGRIRTYLYRGLKVFQVRGFMFGVHALLHTSVFLFFWAISEFFYHADHTFGKIIRYALIAPAVFYMLLSIFPLLISNAPYNTPMTPLLRAAYIIPRITILSWKWFPKCIRGHWQGLDITGLPYYLGAHFDNARLLSMEAEKRAEELEFHAMQWLFTEDDFNDSALDKFLESLPGYISSHHTKPDRLDQYLTADHVLTRIKGHLITCATSVELSDQASVARVSSCVGALVLIFQYSHKRKASSPEPDKLEKEKLSQREHIQRLMDDFQKLCGMVDHTTGGALRASCIRALTVQGFLSQLAPQSSGTTNSSQFTASFIPIHDYLFPNAIAPRLGGHPVLSALEMQERLLHDGSLANLTKLAQAIRDREHPSPPILSFCWRILDILLTQFGTTLSDRATRSQSDFDNLHKGTRMHVNDEEMGFRMAPLLGILGTVARGRRLLKVFSSRPKYYSRANAVFGKEYLQNGDLLETFAHCLPDFIEKNSGSPGVCMDLMEKVVCDDDLWSNLQMILWNTQSSISSTSDKFRIFECCCIVLDVAFLVLEDSREVDWRAPEFGSLWLHFESFVTHCFQGAFMSRAACFRFGIIKARFCKLFLAQIWDDTIHKKVLSFPSQWDAASLAKLIYYLDLRDENDSNFWDAHFNGGHIGTCFAAKVPKMIDRIASDGTLLIFCHLGHLVISAISSYRSGQERENIRKVLQLQEKLKKDERPPINGASDAVWKDLGLLREQVANFHGATSVGTDNDGKVELLQTLLHMIDDVSKLRITATHSEGAGGGPSSSTQIAASGQRDPERGLEPPPSPSGTRYMARGPSRPASPAARQNPQLVAPKPRSDFTALMNPIIRLPPKAHQAHSA